MSMRVLCLAVRDALRDTAQTWYGPGFSPTMVEISPNGQPFAASGDFFAGIHEGQWSTQTVEGLYEVLGVEIIVSVRGTRWPLDMWGPELMAKEKTGLWALVEAMRAQLHLDAGNDRILNLANAYLAKAAGVTVDEVNGIVEPLQLQDGGRSQIRGGDWWQAKSRTGEAEPNAGMSQNIILASAGRVQRSDGPMI